MLHDVHKSFTPTYTWYLQSKSIVASTINIGLVAAGHIAKVIVLIANLVFPQLIGVFTTLAYIAVLLQHILSW